MKIVERGTVFLFSCTSCGTDFVEGVNNVKDYGFSCFKCECPVCGTLVEGIREDKVLGVRDKDEHKDSKQDLH